VAKGARCSNVKHGEPVYVFSGRINALHVIINYPGQIIFIRAVLTHAEYDKDKMEERVRRQLTKRATEIFCGRPCRARFEPKQRTSNISGSLST